VSEFFRSIVRSARFEEELKQFFSSVRRGDDAVEGSEFALARAPERGVPVPQTTLFVWPIYPQGVEYLIYYRYSDEEVTLESIRRGLENLEDLA
jgi:hypothetical protein